MEKIILDNYDFNKNLVFCWSAWVWKTYQARKLLENYNNSQIHDKLQKYQITDAKFKQLVKSNWLNLRKPEEYQSSIELYPLEMMIRVWILLYDDLWSSDVTEAYLRDLLFILDERIEKWLINIITTNLTKDELQTKLNERIISRILLNSDVVIFNWEDKRLTNTKYYNF